MPSILNDDTFIIADNNPEDGLVIRGKSRKSKSKSKKAGGNYKVWADFLGYSGTLPELTKGGSESDVDGFGFTVGLGFPKRGKSLSFFYTHNAPTQEFEQGIGKFKTKNHLFGVMCDKTVDIFQFYGIANAGFDDYKLSGSSASIDMDGWQMNIYGEVAAELPVGNWNIRPHLGLGYHYLSVDFPTGSESPDAFESNLGVRVLRNCLLQTLVFQGRVSWVHQYLSETPIYRMRYGSQVAVMSPTQFYLGGSPGRDWICCGAGLKYYILDPLSVSVDYDLNVSKNITTHIGSLSARLIW